MLLNVQSTTPNVDTKPAAARVPRGSQVTLDSYQRSKYAGPVSVMILTSSIHSAVIPVGVPTDLKLDWGYLVGGAAVEVRTAGRLAKPGA
jgi:hypothetical protein